MARAALTLKQFMLRQQVIKLYRDFFRTINMLDDKGQQVELRKLVREDFKANKEVDPAQEDQIKSLMFNGEKMLRELKQSVDLSRA
jgi:hypothetical protein